MYPTTQLLDNLTAQTEVHLQKAIADWQMLAPELLASTPAAGKWSAAQCLEHLNIYGRFYLPAIETAIVRARAKGPTPAAQFNPGWLGGRFTKMMLPGPDGLVKSRMNSPKNAIPTAQPDPRAMLAEFIEQRERIIVLLAAAADVNLNTIRVPISLTPLVKLKLGDVFLFVTAHDFRHVLQAERAIAAASGVVDWEMPDFRIVGLAY